MAEHNTITFNNDSDKCKILHLGNKNKILKYKRWDIWLSNNSWGKDLRMLRGS